MPHYTDDKMETDMPIHQKDATTDNMITSTEGRLLMRLSCTYVYTCKVSGISLTIISGANHIAMFTV